LKKDQVNFGASKKSSAGFYLARPKIEKQEKQGTAADHLTDNTRHYEGGFSSGCFGVAPAAAKARGAKPGSPKLA
jgi:hypothetical protein